MINIAKRRKLCAPAFIILSENIFFVSTLVTRFGIVDTCQSLVFAVRIGRIVCYIFVIVIFPDIVVIFHVTFVEDSVAVSVGCTFFPELCCVVHAYESPVPAFVDRTGTLSGCGSCVSVDLVAPDKSVLVGIVGKPGKFLVCRCCSLTVYCTCRFNKLTAVV